MAFLSGTTPPNGQQNVEAEGCRTRAVAQRGGQGGGGVVGIRVEIAYV